MATYIITATIKIPNFFFKRDGVGYTGKYRVQSSPFKILTMEEGTPPEELFFRNSLITNDKNIKSTELEVISKNFQNNKEKLEKILTFTNYK